MCQMLKAELKKLSFIPYLILSISGIVLLCLSATGETDMSGKQISIFSLIFQAQQANTDISKKVMKNTTKNGRSSKYFCHFWYVE